MPLPVSSLSHICREVANFVGTQLDATTNALRVLLGTPAEAAKDTKSAHRLNLFFYRFDPSPIQAGVTPGDPWQLRLYCLITPFAIKDGLVGTGEMDLRLLGEVLRIFHENPVLPLVTIDGQTVRLHAIHHPLEMADINHLWSTQGSDVPYRSSLAYEFAASPVVPKKPRVPSPLVGAAGVQATASLATPDHFSGTLYDAPATARTVADSDDWTPIICLVHQGICAQSLAFRLGSPQLAAFIPKVWVVGLPGEAVSLRWDVWDAAAGWRAAGTPIATTASAHSLDPDHAAAATTVTVPLPSTTTAGQALLHAERIWTRPDGVSVTLRSNLLLITLHAAP